MWIAAFLLLLAASFLPLLCTGFAFGPFSALFPPATTTTALPDMSAMAQKIVALHDKKAVFDFCGGMMFQLELSEKLRKDLLQASAQPVVYDASKRRMSQIPGYAQSAAADEINVFHGREVRKVPHAAGGMGFVLQLVSSKDDPEGWSAQEIQEYNGWAHDSGRKWRKAGDHAAEGNDLYAKTFGPTAFGLHHRFYWHLDQRNGLWLSAEDGCEGVLKVW
jgi:hypothetical protein